jgi:two-component system LytT family response regulator
MESKIKCLIIDDDPFIMDLLQDKLMQHLPEVEVIATANSGTEGLKKIAEFKPDLVFLDVEMLDMTGFEMLSQLKTIPFQTIFITSYNHYAIKAIRFNALDYLLKPIDLGELKKSIKRYRVKMKSEAGHDSMNTALHNMQTTDISEHKLVLRTQEGEMKLILKDIIRIVGERNYSYIYLTNSKRKLVTKTLADMEDLLSEKGFFRCHKSFLVNRQHITALVNSITLKMSDQIQAPISRRKKESFKIWFEALV